MGRRVSKVSRLLQPQKRTGIYGSVQGSLVSKYGQSVVVIPLHVICAKLTFKISPRML